MREENAIFMRTFKTKRLDGHSTRTVYFLMETGIVGIRRYLVSPVLNGGFTEIRRFGNFIYQYESMTFKLDSFLDIAGWVNSYVQGMDMGKIITTDEVRYKPNEKEIVKIIVNKSK